MSDVTTQLGITYANHDGVGLAGDLYLPKDAKAAPALVAVHGGGWVQGARAAFQYWGPYLASRGIAVFSISYRLAAKARCFRRPCRTFLPASNSCAARRANSVSIRHASD